MIIVREVLLFILKKNNAINLVYKIGPQCSTSDLKDTIPPKREVYIQS
jgi:hypothetical protein